MSLNIVDTDILRAQWGGKWIVSSFRSIVLTFCCVWPYLWQKVRCGPPPPKKKKKKKEEKKEN